MRRSIVGRRALSLKAGRRPSTALAHTSSPEFLDQRLSKSTLEAATTDATGSVWLRWSDGAGGSFHPLWLRDNCPSVRHAASRQKLVSAAALSRDLAVESVECEPERLRVRWHPDGHVSEFCAAWLRELGGSGDNVTRVAGEQPQSIRIPEGGDEAVGHPGLTRVSVFVGFCFAERLAPPTSLAEHRT